MAVVLIVDDEEELREILKDVFERNGFQTLEAENGQAAQAVLIASHVDAVVSDVRMPKGNGVELLAFIRARDLKIPFVFLVTGYSDLTPEDALKRGAQALFVKPYDLNTLVATVKSHLTAPAGG